MASTRCRRGRGGIRRAATTQAILITVAAVTAVTTVAVVITPRYLRASVSDDIQPTPARVPANQEIIGRIAALIGQSAEVIAVHTDGRNDAAALVLRLEDVHATDRVFPEEIAVLAHSRILQTVTLYVKETSEEAPGVQEACASALASRHMREHIALPGHPSSGDDVAGSAPVPESTGDTFDRAMLLERRFCDVWRRADGVQPRILAAGISDMGVRVVPIDDDRRTLLEFTLTWSSDSADGPDEASVLVDVRMPRAGDQEY